MKMETVLRYRTIRSRHKNLALFGAILSFAGFISPWFNGAGPGFYYWFHSGIHFLRLGKLFVIPIYVLFFIVLGLCIVDIVKEWISLLLPTMSLVLLLAVLHAVNVGLMDIERWGGLPEICWQFGLLLLFPGLAILITSSLTGAILNVIFPVLRADTEPDPDD